MYQNPYALKPGEILSPQFLFERYLNWRDYAEISKPVPCTSDLWTIYFCCPKHFHIYIEGITFLEYLRYLHMLGDDVDGFTIPSMVNMIHTFNLEIDEITKAKLQKFWGKYAGQFFSLLESTYSIHLTNTP